MLQWKALSYFPLCWASGELAQLPKQPTQEQCGLIANFIDFFTVYAFPTLDVGLGYTPWVRQNERLKEVYAFIGTSAGILANTEILQCY